MPDSGAVTVEAVAHDGGAFGIAITVMPCSAASRISRS